jgi:thymidylate synthase (FAD)
MPREFLQQSDSNKQASAGPLEGRSNEIAMIEYAKGLQAAKGAYQTLMALGVSKEQARGVLPTSL